MTTTSPTTAFQGLARHDRIERAVGATVFMGLAAASSATIFNRIAEAAQGGPLTPLYMLPVALIAMTAASVTAASWLRLSGAFNALKQGGIAAAKAVMTPYPKTLDGSANWWGNATAILTPLALNKPDDTPATYALIAGCFALATATSHLGKRHARLLVEETGLTEPFEHVMSERKLEQAQARHRELQVQRGVTTSAPL